MPIPVNRWRIVALVLLMSAASARAGVADAKPRLRQPVALAVSPDGYWQYTANQNSGSLSVIDLEKQTPVDEIDLGGRPSDVAALPDGKHLLALDEQNHRLILLTGGGRNWTTASQVKVARFPVELLVDHKSNRCYVACLWSQAVTVVDLSWMANGQMQPRLRVVKTIRLPFAPRKLCLARDASRLIVAGSFHGVLGVIGLDRHKLIAAKQVPGHNIRGLAVSFDKQRLLTSQQILNPLARSSLDDVHWGNMISNVLCSFDLGAVCDPSANVMRDRQVTHFGQPGDAAGDPGAIVVGPDGRLAIALCGVGQVGVRQKPGSALRRVTVGGRPTALSISRDGKRWFVANTHSDSVSVVDAANARLLAEIALGPDVNKLTPAQLGERLFFDARLSHDGWMSCHSCHTDGHSNGRLNDNLSDGSFGDAKRVLSLLGVAQTGPWAWNGKVTGLRDQVSSSIQKTMRGAPPTDEHVAALVAYLNTLPPPPPAETVSNHDAAAVGRGAQLFEKLDCRRCHKPPTYTSAAAFDVGLEDSTGNTRFNPPSLRGVRLRRFFFHDGRADSLKDVFARHKHQLPRSLLDKDLDDLLRFLKTL